MDTQAISVANLIMYDVGLEKSVSSNTPFPHFYGSEIEFTVEVCNDGNAPISNVAVEDMLGDGYMFLTGNSGNVGWTDVGGGLYRYNVGNIPANSCITLSMFCQVLNNGGPWDNTAQISSATTTTGSSILSSLDLSGLGNNEDTELIQPMAPSGAIGSCVFKDVNGNGVRDLSEPGLPNVSVQLFDGNGILQASTITDNLGNYIFIDLFPGLYYVKFIAPTDYEFTFANQGNNDGLDSDVDGSNGPGTTTAINICLLYTSPSPRDQRGSRMPSSA